MRIQELQVEGYRSLKNVVWKPAALNVLIGPNGGGKTNLIKALEFLSVCGQGDLAEYVQKEGGMQSLVWDAKPGGSFRMKLETKSSEGTRDIWDAVRKKGVFSYEIQATAITKTSLYNVIMEGLKLHPMDGRTSGAPAAPITLVDRHWLQGASILNESDDAMLSREGESLFTEEPLAKFLENDACHMPVKGYTGNFGGQNPVLIHFH